jgi:hypothetical protein
MLVCFFAGLVVQIANSCTSTHPTDSLSKLDLSSALKLNDTLHVQSTSVNQLLI